MRLADSGTFEISLPEFHGLLQCSLNSTSTGYIVRCVAKLDNVEDSYSLKLSLLGGLTFPYGIDSNAPVALGNNVTISGDILLRRGNLGIGNNTVVTGSVYLMGGTESPPDGGTVTLANNVVIERDVLAVGRVTGSGATVKGNVIYADSIDSGITVRGEKIKMSADRIREEISKRVNIDKPPLPVTPRFFPTEAVKLDGRTISASDRTYYTGNSPENGLAVSNTTLTLSIPSSGLLSIAVTKLDLGNNTMINIEGNGTVMIYVRDTLYANQLTINMNENTRLLLYSNGYEDTKNKDADFYLRNGVSVPKGGLHIYAPEKYVNIENAPNLSTPNINGAIVAKSIDVNNGLNFVMPLPLPVEFDPTATGTIYYGLYASYGGWGQ